MTKRMNKTKAINRLFLCTMIWILGMSLCIGWLPFTRNLTTEQLLVLSQILYLMPVFIFLAVTRTTPEKWMPFKPLRPSVIFATILFTILLLPLTTLLNLISMLFVDNAMASTQADVSVNAFWINLLLMAVMPGISEEFITRGIYYHAYRQRGVWCAIIGSAIVFGLMHMNFNQFGYAFALGVAFGLLLEATGSIFATMLAHFTVNGWSVLMMEVSKALSGTEAVAEVASESAISTEDMLMAIAVYMVLAAIFTSLAGLVLVWIAKLSGRTEHLKWCFRRRKRRPGQPRTMITPAFVVITVILVIFMVLIG